MIWLPNAPKAFCTRFRQLLDDFRKLDLPVATRPIPLDVTVSPCTYLGSYFKLASLFQEYGFKPFSPIPPRTAFIPSHMPINTKILVQEYLESPRAHIIYPGEEGGIRSQFVNLQAKAFKPRSGHQFGGTIYSGGISIGSMLEVGTKKNQKAKKNQ